MRTSLTVNGLLISMLILTPLSQAAEITAAVAANFAKTLEEIGQVFTQKTGHTIRLSSGPTGKLFAQIKNGAPFDLFFAADEKSPRTAVETGLALADSYVVYAQGVLVLYSPTLSVKQQAESVLNAASFRHLAIANPKTAPYGAQAEIYLKNKGYYDKIKGKLVHGESIAHAFQYVVTKNAELGFVALSQVIDPISPAYNVGEYWTVPQEDYEPILQAAVITQKGAGKAAADAFMEFVKSSVAIDIIKRYGYSSPHHP